MGRVRHEDHYDPHPESSRKSCQKGSATMGSKGCRTGCQKRNRKGRDNRIRGAHPQNEPERPSLRRIEFQKFVVGQIGWLCGSIPAKADVYDVTYCGIIRALPRSLSYPGGSLGRSIGIARAFALPPQTTPQGTTGQPVLPPQLGAMDQLGAMFPRPIDLVAKGSGHRSMFTST